jgi:hypothetical protein
MPIPPLVGALIALSAGLASVTAAASARVRTSLGDPGETAYATGLEYWRGQHGGSWEVEDDPDPGALLLSGGWIQANRAPRGDAQCGTLALEYVELSREIHGVDSASLVVERVTLLPLGNAGSTDKLAVHLRQEFAGHIVRGGFVHVLMDLDGGLLALHAQAVAAEPDSSVSATISESTAGEVARGVFAREVGARPEHLTAPRLIFEKVGRPAAARLCWLIETFGSDEDGRPAGRLISVCARDGSLVASREAVHAFDVKGSVTAQISPGLFPPGHPLESQRVSRPMRDMQLLWLQGQHSGVVITNKRGEFTIPGIDPPVLVRAGFEGRWAKVINAANGGFPYRKIELLESATGNRVSMNEESDADASTTAQANAFYWVNRLRERLRFINPDDRTADIPLAEIRVNAAAADCSPRYIGGASPAIVLGAAGSACHNASYASIVPHEMGHWLNDLYGIGNDGTAMAEGNADVFGMYLVGDARVGAHYPRGKAFLRSGRNSYRFCGGRNAECYGDQSGRVLMGAFWKLRERLLRSAGRIEGAIVAETLHNAWVNAFGQRRVTKTIVRQLLLVDDDDGNLLNGTPHYADITRAFVEQGFPDLFQDGPGISFSNHEGPTGVQPRLGPFQVEVDVRASFYPPVATVELAYREVRGDAVGEFLYLQPSSSDGEHFTFEIPALEPSVMRVDYFLSAEDSIGQILEFPATRRVWDQAVSPDQLEQPIGDDGDYHRFHLGHVTQAFECGLSPDCARDFDQIAFPWSFGVPLGRGGQTSSGVVWTDPARAFSGQTVFGQRAF